jgi:hypothetical protein
MMTGQQSVTRKWVSHKSLTIHVLTYSFRGINFKAWPEANSLHLKVYQFFCRFKSFSRGQFNQHFMISFFAEHF